MFFIAVITGYFIGLFLFVFFKGGPPFGTIISFMVACYITRERELRACIYIALLLISTSLALTYITGLWNHEFLHDEIVSYAFVSFYAIVTGIAYSSRHWKKRGKPSGNGEPPAAQG
ncbi:MAG TPA: hypothetical protein PLQ76_04410 [bacterium]|nr:hypothetical protein [bacterium]